MKFIMFVCLGHKRLLVDSQKDYLVTKVEADPSMQRCEERTCREPINFLVEIQLH